MRDKNLIRAVHIDTKLNLADLFTKVVDRDTFIRMRNELFRPKPTGGKRV